MGFLEKHFSTVEHVPPWVVTAQKWLAPGVILGIVLCLVGLLSPVGPSAPSATDHALMAMAILGLVLVTALPVAYFVILIVAVVRFSFAFLFLILTAGSLLLGAAILSNDQEDTVNAVL